MSSALHIGGVAVVSANDPTPSISIQKRVTHHAVTGKPTVMQETWTCRGILIAEDGVTVETKYANLLAKFASLDGTQKIEAKIDDTMKMEMDPAAAMNGVRITTPSFLKGEGGEHVTHRTYTFTAAAEFAIETEWAEWTYIARGVSNGLMVYSWSGTYTKVGVDDPGAICEAYLLANVIPAVSQQYTRELTITQAASTSSVFGPGCTFSVTDTENWKDSPTTCVAGSLNLSTEKRVGGPQTLVVSGRFVGKDKDNNAAQTAMTAALGPYAAYKILDSQVVTNEYDGSCSFTYRYLDDIRDVIFEESRMSERPALLDFVMLSRLDGFPPIKQDTVWRPASISQSGMRLGLTAPEPDAPLYPYHQKSHITQRSTVQDINGTVVMHQVDWQYEFLFTETP